jgi:hypothetical protein
MVSSTFFDLKQVREDLRRVIEELGCRPFIAEHVSFPVTSDATAIENCRLRVERDADILVLVLGTRYGSLDPQTLKSITNGEYVAARQKGIPIYACFDKRLVGAIQFWKSNPNADFSRIVDDPRIFEFAERVQSTDGIWKFEFEYAQDIASYLRTQFGFLFGEALDTHRRLRSRGDQPWLDDLTGEALRLVLDQPPAWEYLLFGQVLVDSLAEMRRMRRQQELGLAFVAGEHIAEPMEWIRAQMSEVERMCQFASPLTDGWLMQAFGKPGEPGDAEEIILAAQSFADLCRAFIAWSLRLLSANVPEQFRPLKTIGARFTSETIAEIEKLGPRVIKAVRTELAKPKEDRQPLEFTLRAWIANETTAEFHQELQRLDQHHEQST